MFYRLVHFLMDKIYRNKDKEKYMEFAKDLHGALDDRNFHSLMDYNKSKKSHAIEKDDIER